MRQQKWPIVPKGDAFLHLVGTEKCIPRPLKTHHFVFQQADNLADVNPSSCFLNIWLLR
jgi:hypothetical protein